MNKTPKFRLDKNSKILGLPMKSGDYTPKALAKEMNRVLEAEGRVERFLWNERINKFVRDLPLPKLQSRSKSLHAAAIPN